MVPVRRQLEGSMHALEDKVAIVTGASSGIGHATSKLFALEGAKVVVGARRRAELEALVGQIEASGGTAVAIAGDVRDEAFAEALVETAQALAFVESLHALKRMASP